MRLASPPFPSPVSSPLSFVVALLLICVGAAGAARAADVAPEQQAPILARVLAYDRNLLDRAGEAVIVAVVHQPSDASSVEDGRRMLAAFKALEHLPLKGKPFRAIPLAYSATALADAQRTEGVDAVYLCQGLAGEVSAIVGSARRLKLMSMAGSDSYAAAGVAIGLAVEGGKPRLLVNASASRDEGAQLSSELLRFARVTK